MSKIIKVKNTGVDDVWTGMLIPENTYYQLEFDELSRWKASTKVFQDISSGVLIVNDGSSDIIDPLAGWSYLASDIVYTLPDTSQSSEESGYQKVVVQKSEGSSFTKATHNFCDKTTWYSASVQVANKTLTVTTGSLYSTGDTFLIDCSHGKIYEEDALTTNGNHYKVNLAQGLSDGRIYKFHVYDNGQELTEDVDYIVNYETGIVDLSSYSVQGVLTASYYKATNSSFVLKPKPGKLLLIEHAEMQMSADCQISSNFNFEIWINHPSNSNIKIPYQMVTYKNLKDFLTACNNGTGVFPVMADLQNQVVVLPFQYATMKPLRDSLGAELRITMDSDNPIVGEWGTATFYVLSKDE